MGFNKYRAVSFTTCQLSIYLGTPSLPGRCCREKEVSVQLWESYTVKRKAHSGTCNRARTTWKKREDKKVRTPNDKATSSTIDILCSRGRAVVPEMDRLKVLQQLLMWLQEQHNQQISGQKNKYENTTVNLGRKPWVIAHNVFKWNHS